MNPEQFVAALKRQVREGVEGEIKYYANPPIENPPGHVGVFTRWYQGLSEEQKEVAQQALTYSAEGSLFGILNVFDNIMSLTEEEGAFEVYFVKGDSKIRLNESEGIFLHEMFDNEE